MTSGRSFIVALGAALLVVSSAGDALARRKPRGVFHVIIDGKAMKPTKRLTALTASPSPSLVQSLSLSAQRWADHGHGLQRVLTMSCDMLGKTFPLTTTCYALYSEEYYAVPTRIREWGGLTMQFTVDSYEKGRATGRFGGALADARHGGPPIVVEGFFSMPLEQASPY